MQWPRFTVLGAGHGGLAMAAHLGWMGYNVSLWGRSAQRVAPIAARGGIQLEGRIEGFGPVRLSTNFLPAALAAGDVVMVAIPASAHRELAMRCAPHLRDGQTICSTPAAPAVRSSSSTPCGPRVAVPTCWWAKRKPSCTPAVNRSHAGEDL